MSWPRSYVVGFPIPVENSISGHKTWGGDGGVSVRVMLFNATFNNISVISWRFEHKKQGVLDLLKYHGSLSTKNKVYSIYWYDKVCQWFDAGSLFSILGTTIPSTNKTNRHYIAEILWTVMLDTNNHKSLGHVDPDYPVSLD